MGSARSRSRKRIEHTLVDPAAEDIAVRFLDAEHDAASRALLLCLPPLILAIKSLERRAMLVERIQERPCRREPRSRGQMRPKLSRA